MNDVDGLIERNLLAVLAENSQQPAVSATFPPEMRSYPEQVEKLREYVELAGEYGVAYEALVSMLEMFPFQLSGPVAVKLLEVGLLMKFKTERPEDSQFDSR